LSRRGKIVAHPVNNPAASLWRDAPPVIGVRRKRGGLLIIDCCIFCGAKHVHGDGGDPGPFFGHRVAHCPISVSGSHVGYFLVDREARRDVLLLSANLAPCVFAACHLLHRAECARLYLVFPRPVAPRWRTAIEVRRWRDRNASAEIIPLRTRQETPP
jgi:hypothetical protein